MRNGEINIAKNFTVLFIDQSTDLVGYSVFRNAKPLIYGNFKLSDKNSAKNTYAHTERRVYLIDKLQELINEYKIQFVVYEGIYSTPNIETFKKLSKCQGSIEDMSHKEKIDYEEFPVTEWRSYLPLNAKSKKRQDVKQAVIDYIDSTYPELKNEIEDTKESFAMGLAWINKQNKLLGQSGAS